MQTHIHTYARRYYILIHVQKHSQKHAYVHIHKWIHTVKRTDTNHMYAHTNTNIHTNKHTHTVIHIPNLVSRYLILEGPENLYYVRPSVCPSVCHTCGQRIKKSNSVRLTSYVIDKYYHTLLTLCSVRSNRSLTWRARQLSKEASLLSQLSSVRTYVLMIGKWW